MDRDLWMAFSSLSLQHPFVVDLSFLLLPTFKFSGLSISFALLLLLYFGLLPFRSMNDRPGLLLLFPPSLVLLCYLSSSSTVIDYIYYLPHTLRYCIIILLALANSYLFAISLIRLAHISEFLWNTWHEKSKLHNRKKVIHTRCNF